MVSIGLPVYNGQRYLPAALYSLLAQTFGDFEVIICDNGSSDGTDQICRRYVQQDPRVRYYRSERNVCASRNFNRTFELARGRYFKWAAHDDLCDPFFLERCVAALEAWPDAVLCFSGLSDIDAAGAPIGVARRATVPAAARQPHLRFCNLIRLDYTCEQVFGLIRSDRLKRTPLIGNYSDSDRVLLAALGLQGPFCDVPEVLFFHRLHPGSSVRQHPDRAERSEWFDPAFRGKVMLPYWRELRECFRVVLAAAPGPRQTLCCLLHLGRWTWTNRRRLRADLRQAALAWARLHLPRLHAAWRWLKRHAPGHAS